MNSGRNSEAANLDEVVDQLKALTVAIEEHKNAIERCHPPPSRCQKILNGLEQVAAILVNLSTTGLMVVALYALIVYKN
jgi:hypothetical protein